MLPHQERVVQEYRDLNIKIDKLAAFIGGDTFKDLDRIESFLLVRQLAVMQQYSSILNSRIQHWEQASAKTAAQSDPTPYP